jgi:hypothetical protein
MHRQFTVLPMLILIGSSLFSAQWAMADCSSDYQNALSLLKNTQLKIAHKTHPKLTIFQDNFRKSVNALHAGHCVAELDLLGDYILSEQKKYPTAMPVED